MNLMTDMKHRVLIVDDHALLRAGYRAMLENEIQFEVVGEADNGREGIQAVAELSPHLVLMDLAMPEMNGMEAVRVIKERHPDVRILVITLHKSEEFVRAALQAGADGYILKDATFEELRLAIDKVLLGKTYLSTDISANIVNGYLGGKNAPGSYETLTHREREILKLVAEGKSNKEAADILGISIKTVEKHRSNLMTKLDLHNLAALTAYAIEKGLVVK